MTISTMNARLNNFDGKRHRVAFMCVAAGMALATSAASAQSGKYHDQTYLPAAHNYVFGDLHPGADRLFNAFDYGHSILYETLWRKPESASSVLDVREFGFITTKLLVNPPKIPLDEAAIGPEWTKLAPEALAMFDWAHMLHRQLYDVLADERIPLADQDARVAEVIRYYKSRPALAFSSRPKDMALMEGQPYSLAFRERFPQYNGLVWSYHWLQMTIYDALLAGGSEPERKANVTKVVDRFRAIVNGAPRSLPAVMPMSAAIAPQFTARFPEASIIFDNLHSLHDVVSDILANPNVPRSRKRATILIAAAKYRDATSNITTVDEWIEMSIGMGADQMGGLPPIGKAASPKPATAPHSHH